MLLEVAVIQARLDEQFLPLEPMLTGFRLVPSLLSDEDLERFQQQLGVVLPGHFRSMLLRFDLSGFTIGQVAFCNTGDFLSWTFENNRGDLANENPWWGLGTRPNDLLLVANSDHYAVLLSCSEGAVCVFEHGESWSDHAIVVAKNFGLFVRGLGTAFLERSDDGGNSAMSDEISIEVGGGKGNVFWQWYTG